MLVVVVAADDDEEVGLLDKVDAMGIDFDDEMDEDEYIAI